MTLHLVVLIGNLTTKTNSICSGVYGWLRGTVVERRSVTGELSVTYARPAADE